MSVLSAVILTEQSTEFATVAATQRAAIETAFFAPQCATIQQTIDPAFIAAQQQTQWPAVVTTKCSA